MEATPLISAAVGLLGVITGGLTTAFFSGKRYGQLSESMTTVADNQKKLAEGLDKAFGEILDLREKQESFRDIDQRLTAAVREETGRTLALIKADVAVCSEKIANAVTQRQHQEIIDRLSRIEGILNGKKRAGEI